ncbi:MAG: sugar phosphate nucleotidyltransferase [Patescibacteria group bacterium]
MNSSITTLVLPVAGKGVRLLPLTTNTPKALVPVAGKPLILYLIEEAALSGMKDVVLIMSPDMRPRFEEFLKEIQPQFPELIFHIYEQNDPWGHGHALLTAYDFLKGKPFIIRFMDDLIFGKEPVSLSLSKLFDEYKKPIMLLEPVSSERASSYGIVRLGESISSTVHKIVEFIEKPKDPPSNLSVPGGYVFTPEVLEHLKEAGAEAPQVPDGLLIFEGIHPELRKGGEVLGWQFPGKRFDCGNLEGLAAAEEFLKQEQVVSKIAQA